MQNKNPKPIGIFDSGIGGLTVVKEIKRFLPGEDLVYFGDTARAPYGIKSSDTVKIYASEITSFLIKQNVKMIVVACNTVSSLALEYLRKKFSSIPIIGVVEPGVRAAINSNKNKRIGIIGTVATINSHTYENLLLKKDPSLKIFEKPCPLFVSLVEEGWESHKVAELVAEEYLSYLKKSKIDTLVLGCTHYPLLKPVISKVMGDSIKLVDSAEETAILIKEIILKNNLSEKKQRKGKITCWLSDRSLFFIKAAERLLDQNIRILQKRF